MHVEYFTNLNFISRLIKSFWTAYGFTVYECFPFSSFLQQFADFFFLCCSCCLHCVTVIFVILSHSFSLFLLLIHQRCSSTSLSNSSECFYVSWSWTDHLPRRNERHRKQSQWPLLLFIEWIYSLHRRYHVERSTLRIIREPAFFPQAACVTIAALMQYFLMAAFCWMLIEGIYLYFFVVKVYNINTKMYMYHVTSWGEFIILKHW